MGGCGRVERVKGSVREEWAKTEDAGFLVGAGPGVALGLVVDVEE